MNYQNSISGVSGSPMYQNSVQRTASAGKTGQVDSAQMKMKLQTDRSQAQKLYLVQSSTQNYIRSARMNKQSKMAGDFRTQLRQSLNKEDVTQSYAAQISSLMNEATSSGDISFIQQHIEALDKEVSRFASSAAYGRLKHNYEQDNSSTNTSDTAVSSNQQETAAAKDQPETDVQTNQPAKDTAPEIARPEPVLANNNAGAAETLAMGNMAAAVNR